MHARDMLTWAVVAAIGWGGLIWIGAQLYNGSPDQVGFDLELLLAGGRAVAAGQSPYDPAMLGGAAPAAPSLFYSYPPPVAQALAPFAAVPTLVMLVAWDLAAILGLAVVAEGLRRRFNPARTARSVVIPVLASAPLVLPLAIGMLFGNLDVFFPALYGVMLLGAVSTERTARAAAGVALAVASLKLHPASLGLWFLTRAARRGDPVGGRPIVTPLVAALTGLGIIALSIGVFGIEPWQEYLEVVRAGSGADIVDGRNAAVGAQLALVVGGGEGLARGIHIVVAVVAVALTAWSAWSRRDPVESLGWAALASLSTLPVTWYHYPSAMIPFALAALLRAEAAGSAGRTRWLVLAAAVVGGVAIAWLPLVWVAGVLVILATRASAPLRLPGASPSLAAASGSA